MIQQLDAFALPNAFPRARNSDPISSKQAADEVERTGLAKTQAERVLAALKRYPNSTSMELSRTARIERYAVARRLPELLAAGLVTRMDPTEATAPCAVSRKRVCRWCAR